ncbi:MAG: hypothetical protein Q7T56_08770 [Nocardioidaceae bacterium]|nr:hypothetical protein [Nocardioidaceae bacterium]
MTARLVPLVVVRPTAERRSRLAAAAPACSCPVRRRWLDGYGRPALLASVAHLPACWPRALEEPRMVIVRGLHSSADLS